MGQRWSHRELDELSSLVACSLQELGAGPGVHVGLLLPNSPHYVAASWGTMKSGAALVNYSPLDAAEVLRHKIEDSETDVVLTVDLAAMYPQMAAVLGGTQLKKLVAGNIGEMTPTPEAVNDRLRAAGQLAEIQWDESHMGFADLVDNGGGTAIRRIGALRSARRPSGLREDDPGIAAVPYLRAHGKHPVRADLWCRCRAVPGDAI